MFVSYFGGLMLSSQQLRSRASFTCIYCTAVELFLENSCKTFWYLVDLLHYLSPAISDSIAPLLTLHDFALHPQSERFVFI